MNGRRHSAEKRAEAMGALMASAVLQDGELVPNYAQVSPSVGVSRKVLRKWWTGRDKTKDAHLRPPVTRAREVARQRGAQASVDQLLYAAELAISHLSQPETWRDVPVHQAARALESIARSHERIVAILSDPEEDKSTSTMDRAREAVKRTGLGRLLRGDDT
tara:strand:- start:59 stop:544 length:486 start_codon:yes stop_codon:yes gene_type:complete